MSTQAQTGDLPALVEVDGRRVFVSDEPIDFRRLDQPNDVYVLEFSAKPSGKLSKAYHYKCGAGECIKVAEFFDGEDLEGLEVPDQQSTTIVMPDGRSKFVHGIVDRRLVESYKQELRQ